MSRKQELATIKPSEHLELIIYRIESVLSVMKPGEELDTLDQQLFQLDRLYNYLKESGQ